MNVGSPSASLCMNGIKVNSTASGINIHNNVIYESTMTPIDLSGGTEDAKEETANDSGDADTGANNLMNYPIIESVEYLGSSQYKLMGNVNDTVSGRV